MSIEHFSRQVAARRVDLEVAEASFADAADQAKQIHQRIAAIRARSEEITAARLAGTAGPESAAELFALSEDARILDGLHRDAEDHADAAKPDRERAALAQAEADLRRATEEAQHAALIAHTREIEILFKRSLAAVQKSARARGTARTAADAYRIDGDLLSCARQNTWLAADRGG